MREGVGLGGGWSGGMEGIDWSGACSTDAERDPDSRSEIELDRDAGDGPGHGVGLD